MPGRALARFIHRGDFWRGCFLARWFWRGLSLLRVSNQLIKQKRGSEGVLPSIKWFIMFVIVGMECPLVAAFYGRGAISLIFYFLRSDDLEIFNPIVSIVFVLFTGGLRPS